MEVYPVPKWDERVEKKERKRENQCFCLHGHRLQKSYGRKAFIDALEKAESKNIKVFSAGISAMDGDQVRKLNSGM